jgi:ring-1,2-phenylacetyl-CoA epoxidase subunit PaaC
MTTTSAAAPPRAGAALLTRLADEELFVGHVLTSIAGFGPELEINLSLSSIGQDELGHCRLLHVLVHGPDRAAVNAAIWGRPADGFTAAPISAAYTEDWADCVAAHLLYDTADAHRTGLLARCADDAVRDVAAKVAVEERYHVDFWTTWLGTTVRAGGDARARVQDALDRFVPLGADLFDPADAADLGLGADDWADAHAAWRDDLTGLLRGHDLDARWDGPAPDLAADEARIVDELHFVHREAPGRW